MADAPASRTVLLLATVALFALFGTSWWLSYLPLGRWSIPIALGIAVAKGVIILTAFMRLHRQPVANRVVVGVAVALVVILVGLVAVDAVRR